MTSVLSLFAGIGGLDLGLHAHGYTTTHYSEIDSHASRVMAHRFPSATNLGDITTINWHDVPPPTIICGGFPCQDISIAGKGAGINGQRSGLWSHYADAIRVLRPRGVIVENVAALLHRGIDRVLGDLAACGYDAEWDCIPAAAVGAPHLRDRVFIIAYAAKNASQPDRASANANCRRGPHHELWTRWDKPRRSGTQWPIPERSDQWLVEPDVGRMAHGVPHRVDRLRCLGNAVVPQVAQHVASILHQRITQTEQ